MIFFFFIFSHSVKCNAVSLSVGTWDDLKAKMWLQYCVILPNSLCRGCISPSVRYSLSLQGWIWGREVRKALFWTKIKGKGFSQWKEHKEGGHGTHLILTLEAIEAIVTATVHSSRSWNMYNPKSGLLLAFQSFKPVVPNSGLWHSLCFRFLIFFFYIYTKYHLLSDC